MVTDPPYGVNYDPEWRHRAGVNSSSRIGKVENDGRADWAEAWALFPGNIAYVWHGALHAATVAASLEREGFTIRAQIIWAKERLVIGRGDYHWQHEPCWYAVRAKGNWTGDRKQTTLWSISSKDQDAETVHGTQKPVECMRRPIVNNTSPGEAVYEPFLGSGTTLIAAESVGRICFAVELSPAYVDVAVRRWQAFTGRKAIRLSDGLEFDEISATRRAADARPPPETHPAESAHRKPRKASLEQQRAASRSRHARLPARAGAGCQAGMGAIGSATGPLRMITHLDRAALASYCAAYALWAEATQAIQTYGAMVKSPSGYPVQSPYVSIANRQTEIMMRIASEFGLTPASRSRISAPAAAQPSLIRCVTMRTTEAPK